jgi:uncharacterized protein
VSRPDPYAARHGYFALAGGAWSVWAILGGLLVVELVWGLAGSVLAPWPPGETGTPFRTLSVHLAFLVIGLTTAWIVRRFQQRNPVSLLGPPGRALGDFGRVVRALLIFLAVTSLIPGAGWSETRQTMDPLAWFFMLPVACIAVLIQTGSEELLYRGYLLQSLGARRDSSALWMALPALLFGLSHYNPTIPFDATLEHVIWTTAFGLAAADLTARTGSLGAAIGLHFTHNLPLVVLYATPGDLSGFSLLSLPVSWVDEPRSAITLGFELFYLWMLWMVCRIAIRR